MNCYNGVILEKSQIYNQFFRSKLIYFILYDFLITHGFKYILKNIFSKSKTFEKIETFENREITSKK